MANVPSILATFCKWINGLGYKAIQGPSNNPAPAGKYVSVSAANLNQVGSPLIPGPRNGERNKYRKVINTLTVQMYGVEDDGEMLRAVRNSLESDAFDDFVAQTLGVMDSGDDAGFSLLDVSEIVDNGFQDGAYYIQQKAMTAEVQFMDFIGHDTERMESVSGMMVEITKGKEEPFSVEVTDG